MINQMYQLKKLPSSGYQEQAFAQIKAKNYQQKYLNDGKPIYLIGIDFDAGQKAVARFEWEVA